MDAAGDAAAPSLGLMKGVMLCNRPVPPEAITAQRAAAGGSAFKVGITKELTHPMGRDPLLDALADLKISSSSGAPSLDKHVAWLQDVTRQREALMAAQAEAQRKREEKRRAVAAQQQAFRDLVRANEDGCLGDTVPVGLLTPRAAAAAKEAGLLSGSSKPAGSLREAPAGPAEAGHSARAAAASVRASGAGGGSHGYSGSGSAPSRPDAAATGKENRGDATGKAAAPPAAAATAAAAAAARKKPAWARSEGAQAALEDEDADQLLQFAEGLDFDRYVDDLEAKAEDTAISSRLAAISTVEQAAAARLAELEAADAAKERERRRRRLKRKRAAAAAAAGGGDGAGGDGEGKDGEADSGAGRNVGFHGVEGEAGDLSVGAKPRRKKGLKGKGKKGGRKGGRKGGGGEEGADEDGGMGSILAAIAADMGVAKGSGAGAGGGDDLSASRAGRSASAGPGGGRRGHSRSAADTGAGASGEGGEAGGRSVTAALEALRARLLAQQLGSAGEGKGDEGSGEEKDGSDDESESDEEGGDGSSYESDDSGHDTLGTLATIKTARPVRVRAGDDSGSIATSVLSSASSIRSVHSKRSLTHMIDRHMAKEQARIAAAVAAGYTDDTLQPIAPPRMVVSSEYAGALQDKRGLVGLLPYQRRNPAV